MRPKILKDNSSEEDSIDEVSSHIKSVVSNVVRNTWLQSQLQMGLSSAKPLGFWYSNVTLLW